MYETLEGEAATAVAAYRDAVSGLIILAGTNLPGTVVMDVLRGVQSETNRLAVADHAFIAELESQGTARELTRRNTTTLLSELLNIHPGEAGARVEAAAQLGLRRRLTGEQLLPVFERVAAAQASGAVCAGHARVITKTITGLTIRYVTRTNGSSRRWSKQRTRTTPPNSPTSPGCWPIA